MSRWVAKRNVPRSQFVSFILAVFPPILERDKCLVEWPSETPPEATFVSFFLAVFSPIAGRDKCHACTLQRYKIDVSFCLAPNTPRKSDYGPKRAGFSLCRAANFRTGGYVPNNGQPTVQVSTWVVCTFYYLKSNYCIILSMRLITILWTTLEIINDIIIHQKNVTC